LETHHSTNPFFAERAHDGRYVAPGCAERRTTTWTWRWRDLAGCRSIVTELHLFRKLDELDELVKITMQTSQESVVAELYDLMQDVV
jgi:hypothetical protein